MDINAVIRAYECLTVALPGIGLHYALKCNGFRPVVKVLHGIGCEFEVASASELDELVAIGVDPARVLYSNPVKPVRHIARAYQAGVRQFAFDSRNELIKLAAVAPGSKVSVRLAANGMHSDV